jgi:hypothetical protein
MANGTYEIAHPEYLSIARGDEVLYGCDQEWYKILWRRRAGCGPVAATNLLLYLAKKHCLPTIPYSNGTVEDAAAAMNDVFQFVRPTITGLHTTKLFVNGVRKLSHRYGVRFNYHILNIPPHKAARPSLEAVGAFIADGLSCDAPIAFLNLHAGDVEELDGWHWVTIVGLDAGSDSGELTTRFFDYGKSLSMNIGKWLSTSLRGGGFVYLDNPATLNGSC